MSEPETNSKENGGTCLQCFHLLISVNFPSFYYIFFFSILVPVPYGTVSRSCPQERLWC